MTWFWPFDSFDNVPVILLQLKMRERKNRTVTIIFDPASVTAEFEVWIRRNYGETVGVNRAATSDKCIKIRWFIWQEPSDDGQHLMSTRWQPWSGAGLDGGGSTCGWQVCCVTSVKSLVTFPAVPLSTVKWSSVFFVCQWVLFFNSYGNIYLVLTRVTTCWHWPSIRFLVCVS